MRIPLTEGDLAAADPAVEIELEPGDYRLSTSLPRAGRVGRAVGLRGRLLKD